MSARVVDVGEVYASIEDMSGADIPLRVGDRVIVVLANRRSGSNPSGHVPRSKLRPGDRLDVLAAGGLAGELDAIPPYLGRSTSRLEYEGFFSAGHGPLELCHLQRLPMARATRRTSPRLAVILGTSAESGKTTVACAIAGALLGRRNRRPPLICKFTGTGRLRDLARYRRSGSGVAFDFVDAGLPSTYELRRRRWEALLGEFESAMAEADTCVVESGGDLLEAGVPHVIRWAIGRQARFVLCAQDALGARAGLALLRRMGAVGVVVATLRQNPLEMSRRLKGTPVLYAGDGAALLNALHSWGSER